MTPHYLAAARRLVPAAPRVFAYDTVALKGGTAINLFVRDMPRLSVDLDLVLADGRASRDEALARVAAALKVAENRLHHHGFVVRLPRPADVVQTKLFARRDGAEVKVEVNHVMRGTMQPVRRAALVRAACEALKADIALPMLADDELYAGKLVAALDRQHPRDLYDVMQLYAHGGIPPAMRQNFDAYLACHNRPVHEVLFATKKDIAFEFARSFAGMTAEPVALDALEDREPATLG